MVEHLVANQMMGVRFSLPALHSPLTDSYIAVYKLGDTGDKGQKTFIKVHEIVNK